MDRERFDVLVRLFATKGSRRTALSALLGAAILGHSPHILAGRGKGKGNGRGKGRGNGRHKGKPGQGKGHQTHGDDDQAKSRGHRRTSGNSRRKTNKPIEAEAGGCCGAKSCAVPSLKSARPNCNYAGADLSGVNGSLSDLRSIDGRKTTFSTATRKGNWSQANFSDACLGGARFTSADLRKTNFANACLVDADLSNALGDSSTNYVNAVLCRTRMPNGSINNSGCGKASACCPVCDREHPCAAGQSLLQRQVPKRRLLHGQRLRDKDLPEHDLHRQSVQVHADLRHDGTKLHHRLLQWRLLRAGTDLQRAEPVWQRLRRQPGLRPEPGLLRRRLP